MKESDSTPQSKHEIERSIGHISETNPVRRTFWHMDKKVEKLITGVQQGDDAIVVGDMVYNMEGPYPLKIGMKTGLIHTCSDIVVMGAKPLFALDSMQVGSVEQSLEVAQALKKQSDGLGVPLVGGNTQMENDLTPCISFTVVGKLITDKIIPDSTARAGDTILMLGQPVEGEVGERVARAKRKFETFLECIQKVDVHASKDASRGGWFGNLIEMMIKAHKGFKITSIPFQSFSRYLGTYMAAVSKNEKEKIVSIAARHSCPVIEMGQVTKSLAVTMGGEEIITAQRMQELIRENPFKRPNP
ncbi:MAG: hypothetical protein JXB14_00155 [Candidatus Altiarchaeota archaeon]|nr:hypothetical protein [Candidatus Altiarchaeota archaeon]